MSIFSSEGRRSAVAARFALREIQQGWGELNACSGHR